MDAVEMLDLKLTIKSMRNYVNYQRYTTGKTDYPELLSNPFSGGECAGIDPLAIAYDKLHHKYDPTDALILKNKYPELYEKCKKINWKY